jgi:hypothetical protein
VGVLGGGELTFTVAYEEGTALSLEEVAAYAFRARGERKRPALGCAARFPNHRRDWPPALPARAAGSLRRPT